MLNLPDIETVAAAIHADYQVIAVWETEWGNEDRKKDPTEFAQLSEKKRDVYRGIVRTVYDAIRAAGEV